MTDDLNVRLAELVNDPDQPPQSRLPPERELATRYGVSRARLRRALAALEAEGRIWRHVGQGTFIGRRPPVDPEVVARVVKITNPAEVMEARLVIEPKLASLAAVRATPEQIEHMETCLRKSSAAIDRVTYELWDSSLHRAIAEASGNALLLAVFNAVNAAREDRLWGRLKEASLTDVRRARYTRQHQEIVGVIRDRDANAAERLMRQHLEAVRADLLVSGHPVLGSPGHAYEAHTGD